MPYDYATCKRSLECLFGLGSLGKITFLEQTYRPPPSERYGSCSVLATVEQKVECTVAEGQDVPGTQIREDCNQKSGHFGTNNVASIDSTPLTSFQTSSAIKRNHKETTDWLEETLTTDPTS
ncbi:hypothetical protein TNCV_2101101 [Trichonephila clavipes]|nr:hypothetical protein TNCV_2101101 [Trichonephila clavipes]